MKKHLSISNIAWPAAEDHAALALAASLGYTGIELAPMKVFGSLEAASTDAVSRYRGHLADAGLSVSALQAVLFGIHGIHLFETEEMRVELARRLTQVAVLAGRLGGVPCVFGAPKLRDPGAQGASWAFETAVRFFSEIAPVFEDHGSRLCLEANPSIYGCRFVTRTCEALAVVKAVARSGFGLHFDTGTVFVNCETGDEFEAGLAHAIHLHVSEPQLAPIGSSGAGHAQLAAVVAKSGYTGWVSVEMKETSDWHAAMREAALVARLYLGG